MSIGTKIKKKYYYQFSNNNKNYKIIKNNNERKNSKNSSSSNLFLKKSKGEASFQRCLIDDKISLENLNNNNIKSNKMLTENFIND